jgi:flavin-dependent dehydrogenase
VTNTKKSKRSNQLMTNPTSPAYDVIIVGGRPAGSSLAVRLGQLGLRVLIVERNEFPSAPAVSTPFILPHTMALLDELGVAESAYAHNTPPITRFVLEFKDYFRVPFRVQAKGGRDYLYTAERARFDTALWQHLENFATVTAVSNFAVTDLLQDDAGNVYGIIGRHPQQPLQQFTAKLVVGADGRFSTVASKVNAPVIHQRTDVDTTLYYAFWQNVAPYDETGEAIAHIHTSVDGFSYVFMPTADGHTAVIAQGQANLYDPPAGSVQPMYEELLQRQPHVWRRLRHAQQVSKISGMKRIGNLFRQATGPGWALVGDAYHQKDSLDAQGIYDTLLSSKYLAEELAGWQAGQQSLTDAQANYGTRIYAALRPMFDATMGRVQRELYDIPPTLVAKTVLRWVLTSPTYQQNFGLNLIRELPDPVGWTAPPQMIKMLGSGLGSALGRGVRRAPDPYHLPPASALPQGG